MEYNKSLSARIKRRNAQGFKGEGSYTGHRVNPNPGNYRDPRQNHKHDGDIHWYYNPDTKVYDLTICPSRHQHIINHARRYGSRHVGSKPMKTLMSHF